MGRYTRSKISLQDYLLRIIGISIILSEIPSKYGGIIIGDFLFLLIAILFG